MMLVPWRVHTYYLPFCVLFGGDSDGCSDDVGNRMHSFTHQLEAEIDLNFQPVKRHVFTSKMVRCFRFRGPYIYEINSYISI